MRFVVTGTGRCGTGYTAALFTAAGVPCGHEAVYGTAPGLFDKRIRRLPRRPLRRAKAHLGRLSEERRRRRSPLLGDASWMAVPRLARFDGAKFLQVRDPLKVVASFQGTRFFEHREKLQTQFALAYFEPCGDPMVDAMRWWVYWNTLAEQRADFTYRLEDLDADLLARLCVMAGVEPPVPADAAVEATEQDVNSGASRGHAPLTLGWDDLPSGDAKDQLARMAARWRYA